MFNSNFYDQAEVSDCFNLLIREQSSPQIPLGNITLDLQIDSKPEKYVTSNWDWYSSEEDTIRTPTQEQSPIYVMKMARIKQEEEIKKFVEGVTYFEKIDRKMSSNTSACSSPKKQKRIKKIRN